MFWIGILLVFLAGCAGKQVAHDDQMSVIPAKLPMSQYAKPGIQYMIDAYDPWEGFNRRMYNFNYHFDRYLFLPVVKGYEFITPDYLEDRVSNFFKNVGELDNFTNSLFQLKGRATATTLWRFVVNTTVGLLGLYDPATHFGLPRQNEDFGQTLGHYGMGAGPFLVLPIFGPSSLRDTTGLIFDSAVEYAVTDPSFGDDDDGIKLGLNLLRSVDVRHRTPFRYYRSGSPFEYDLIRKLYLQQRDILIAK